MQQICYIMTWSWHMPELRSCQRMALTPPATAASLSPLRIPAVHAFQDFKLMHLVSRHHSASEGYIHKDKDHPILHISYTNMHNTIHLKHRFLSLPCASPYVNQFAVADKAVEQCKITSVGCMCSYKWWRAGSINSHTRPLEPKSVCNPSPLVWGTVACTQ